MRSKVHAPYVRALSQASAIVILSGVITACSNDVTRFEDVLTTNTSMTANQHAIIRSKGPVSQPYPGDLDSLTTASVKSGAVSKYNELKASRPPLVSAPTALSAPKAAISSGVEKVKSVFKRPSAPTVPSAVTAAKNVYQAPTRIVPNKGLVLAKPPTAPAPLKIVGTDPMATGSVSRPAPQPSVPQNTPSGSGWKGAGGTWVTVKQGETLYNLSRRYGVPVDAIMKANNIADANSLSSGAKIMIPAYTYNKTAKVSAPDANPITNASRASSGFQGQARTDKVAIPKRPTGVPALPVTTQQAVQTSVGQHTVASGDTLYSIARKHGVSTTALKTHNNLSDNVIRLGQKLRVPGSASGNTVVAAAPTPATSGKNIDPVVTSSVPAAAKNAPVSAKKIVKPSYTTPAESLKAISKASEGTKQVAKTSSGAFRWPARGRVIHKFGSRINGATNDGIDISVPEGTPVKATENGTVIYSGSELADFGNLILVSHSGGWVSAYAHASKNNVKRGDKVTRGQVIAMSGKSGNATTPKLHFELRKNSTPVDPMKHLSKY